MLRKFEINLELFVDGQKAAARYEEGQRHMSLICQVAEHDVIRCPGMALPKGALDQVGRPQTLELGIVSGSQQLLVRERFGVQVVRLGSTNSDN